MPHPNINANMHTRADFVVGVNQYFFKIEKLITAVKQIKNSAKNII